MVLSVSRSAIAQMVQVVIEQMGLVRVCQVGQELGLY